MPSRQPIESWPPMLGGRAGRYSVAGVLTAALMWFAQDAQAQLRELRERMMRLESQIDRIADHRCDRAERSDAR